MTRIAGPGPEFRPKEPPVVVWRVEMAPGSGGWSVTHGGHDECVAAQIYGLLWREARRIRSVPAACLRDRVIEVTGHLDPAFRRTPRRHPVARADVDEFPDTIIDRVAAVRVVRLQPEDRVLHRLAEPIWHDSGSRTADSPSRRHEPEHLDIAGPEAGSPGRESVDANRRCGIARWRRDRRECRGAWSRGWCRTRDRGTRCRRARRRGGFTERTRRGSHDGDRRRWTRRRRACNCQATTRMREG